MSKFDRFLPAAVLCLLALLALFQFFTTRLAADIVLKRAYEGKT